MDEPSRSSLRDEADSTAEMIDSAARKIMTGLVLGGAIVALAIYSRPEPPQFEVDVVGSTVLRTDMRSGTVLACEGQRCYTVVRRGQRLEDGPAQKAVSAPPGQGAPALPSPVAEAETAKAQ